MLCNPFWCATRGARRGGNCVRKSQCNSDSNSARARPRAPAGAYRSRKARGCLLKEAMGHGPRERHQIVVVENPSSERAGPVLHHLPFLKKSPGSRNLVNALPQLSRLSPRSKTNSRVAQGDGDLVDVLPACGVKHVYVRHHAHSGRAGARRMPPLARRAPERGGQLVASDVQPAATEAQRRRVEYEQGLRAAGQGVHGMGGRVWGNGGRVWGNRRRVWGSGRQGVGKWGAGYGKAGGR
eukprot:56483-Chlamydomonas_euryale.AAC.2